jgi:SpoVK/Ycf46/Vps4 family AAA+-type ATPase
MAFITIYCSDVKSKWSGHSEKIVRAIFNLANIMAPSIVFIDEAEELFSSRDKDSGSSGASGITTTFLTSMENSENVLTIAATNYPWKIDSAITRRLENRICINLPDFEDRKNLISLELDKRKNCIQPHEIPFIAKKVEGYSCHDITMVVNDAHKLAFNRLSNWKYFCKSQATGKWIACLSQEIGVYCGDLLDFDIGSNKPVAGQKYDYLPIDIIDIEMAVNKRQSTITKETAESYLQYAKQFSRKN